MILAVIAFALAHVVQKETPFTFLGDKIPEKTLRVVRVSQDGNVILLAGDGKPTSPLWILSKDSDGEQTDMAGTGESVVAVANDGTLVSNTRDRLDPRMHSTGGVSRGFWAKGGVIENFDTDRVGFVHRAVMATGLSRGQLPMGLMQDFEVIPARCTLVVGKPGSWSPVYFGADPVSSALLADTSLGYLAHLTMYFRTSSTNRIGRTLPAYIRAGEAFPFDLPESDAQGMATAWSSDGVYVAGHTGLRSIIWRGGKVWIIPREGKKVVNFIPYGISDEGAFVVGTYGRNKPVAVVWTEETGVVTLAQYLADHKIKVPDGWKLIEAKYLSPDAEQIIGTAENPEGLRKPFRVVIKDNRRNAIGVNPEG